MSGVVDSITKTLTGQDMASQYHGPGTQSLLTGGQGTLLDALTSLLSGQLGQGVDPYGGKTVAGESDIQSKMFGGIPGMVAGGSEALNKILGDFDPTLATGAWEKGVKDPMMKMFKEEILPGVIEPFAGAGAVRSGAAERAMGKAGSGFATQLMADLSSKLFEGEQAHLGRQAGATGMLPGLTQLGLQAGGEQRGIAQDILGEGFQKWQMSQGYNNPWLQQLGLGLGTQAIGQTQPWEQKGAWGQFMGK